MVWDLAGQYRTLSEAARDARRRFQEFAGVPRISIPPIAFLAISRCRHFDELFAELLQLRHDFAALRKKLTDLEEQLAGGHLSPRQALELEKTWRERWETVGNRLGTESFIALARTSAPLLRDGAKLVTAAAKQDVGGALEATIAWIGHGVATLGSMQLRPVHRAVSNYMRTTDQQLKGAVARLFQQDFVRIDDDMRALATQAGSPWRLALEPAPRAGTRVA